METPKKTILSDPMVSPDDELIAAILGDKIEWWHDIMDHTTRYYPFVTPLWKYYNDGKQWLFRLLQKKQTIFWTSLIDDTFRITLYFTDKYEPFIMESTLPDEIKTGFLSGKRFGKIRGITVKIDKAQDLEAVKELVSIKLQIK